jgi:adenylate cyclase
VVVGNIGTETRTKYGAVGSAVNTVFRIESLTVGGQVLVSAATCEALGDALFVRDRLEVQFKGLDGALTLYEVAGFSDAAGPVLAGARTDTVTPLVAPCRARCFVVTGKEINQTPLPGEVTAVGETTIELRLDTSVALFTNLKILLVDPLKGLAKEQYGKVTGKTQDTGALRVTLTGSPGV